MVDIVRFAGPDCSAAVFTVTNRGTAEQPFGWTLSLSVRKTGIDQTFFGQQPLAPGETRESIMGTGLTDPGNYFVEITPGDVLGGSKPGHAMLKLPSSC